MKPTWNFRSSNCYYVASQRKSAQLRAMQTRDSREVRNHGISLSWNKIDEGLGKTPNSTIKQGPTDFRQYSSSVSIDSLFLAMHQQCSISPISGYGQIWSENFKDNRLNILWTCPEWLIFIGAFDGSDSWQDGVGTALSTRFQIRNAEVNMNLQCKVWYSALT